MTQETENACLSLTVARRYGSPALRGNPHPERSAFQNGETRAQSALAGVPTEDRGNEKTKSKTASKNKLPFFRVEMTEGKCPKAKGKWQVANGR